MSKMTAQDRFVKICDFISAQNIVDEVSRFLGEDDLHEFCDYLKEEYDIDIEDEFTDEYDDEEEY